MRPSMLALLFLALTPLAGCPTSTTLTDDDAARSDADAVDAAIDADLPDAPGLDSGDTTVSCSGHDAMSFPAFDRACVSDSDCEIAAHQTDCCGTLDAMGIAASESARFAAAEALCESQYPACGCDSGTVNTDDGTMPPPGSGTSAVVVRCLTGVCTTSARASMACGATTCTPTQVCVMECSGVPVPDGGVLASHCVDVPPACADTTDCACFGANPCPTGSCVSVDHGAPVCLCA